jgi:hypothetical protein
VSPFDLQKNPADRKSHMSATQLEFCDIQRRSDGTVLVRVRSSDRQGRPLPDAVFTFHRGDPQYDYWEQQYLVRAKAAPVLPDNPQPPQVPTANE